MLKREENVLKEREKEGKKQEFFFLKSKKSKSLTLYFSYKLNPHHDIFIIRC